MKIALKKLARQALAHLGYIAMTLERYHSEQAILANVKQATENSECELQTLRTWFGAYSAVSSKTQPRAGEIYTEVFAYDGLHTDPRIIHNHDFMYASIQHLLSETRLLFRRPVCPRFPY